MLDKYLLGSLAVRDGLSKEIAKPTIEQIEEKSILSRELYKQLRDSVQHAVRRQFSLEETTPTKARDPVIKSKFNNIVHYHVKELKLTVNEPDIPVLGEQLFSDILGYGPLEKYFNNPDVTEIKVNGLRIRVEISGVEEEVKERFESIEQGVDLLRRMIATTGGRIDQAKPRVNARLHDGSRLNAQIYPIAPDGLLITIRRFKQDITIEKLIETKAISRTVVNFLQNVIELRLNAIVAGGTSTGKTTWLNNLASFIDHRLSIVTIEDPAELQLQHPDVRRLEAREANIEGEGEYTIADGMQDALRMAPKIIIAGEVRDKEAFDLLQAMGTGHEGSLGTGHSNSAAHLLHHRLPNMIEMADKGLSRSAIVSQIADILDIVIYVTKEKNGRRRLDHISEVVGVEFSKNNEPRVKQNILWQYNPRTDDWDWVAKEFNREELFEEVGWFCPN